MLEPLLAVWNHSPLKGTELLVMMALADGADENGDTYTSFGRLAAKSRVDKRRVRRLIAQFVENGYLEVVERGGMIGDRRISNLYRLTDLARGGAGALPGEGAGAPPGGAPAPPNTTSHSSTSSSEKTEREAAIERVHAHFVARCNPRVKTLSPSRKRLIDRALNEAPEEVLIDAIEGMIAYVNSGRAKDPRFSLDRMFNTRPGGSSLGEQIEWWASQKPAEGSTGGEDEIPPAVANSLAAMQRAYDQRDWNDRAMEFIHEECDRLETDGWHVILDKDAKPLRVARVG